MEPTNMPDKHAKPDAAMPGRVHGADHAAANEHMPRSVWQPGVVRVLADYIKQLRQVDDESNKRPVACQSSKSAQSGHVCTRNPHRSCNCHAGVCADDDATYRNARGPFVAAPKPNQLGNFRCPISGQLCSSNVCRDWCESGVDYSKT